MISPRHLEGIAREIHERTGVTPPIDAFELATLCGFMCRPWGRGGGKIDIERREIRFPLKARHTHQHGVVAHELGHFALNRGGEDDRDEDACRYMAGAFMLPHDQIRADVRSTDYDLFALMALHPNASAQMIVVRMTQVCDATASVWDAGKLHSSYGAVDLDSDRATADLVLESGVVIRGRVDAWPIFDGVFRRVVCVRRAA